MKIIMTIATLGTAAIVAAGQVRGQVSGPGPIPNGHGGGSTGVMGLDGTVDKFYGATHRAVVKTADGVRHIVHVSGRTVVHGAAGAANASFTGLEEGSRVAVHYVVEGERKTAVEIDRAGKGGLDAIDATVEHIDRAAKTMSVRLSDGTVMTLQLTERAAQDVGKDVARADRVVVYYADESGKRVAHFFKKIG
jgi:hypothetical protein